MSCAASSITVFSGNYRRAGAFPALFLRGMKSFLLWIDPWCIAPYRWFPGLPEWGYIVGTCVLAAQAVLLGLLTLRLGQRMHAARLKELRTEMRHYHKLSERALRESGKEAYKAVNRQGHEAFGYYFSLNGALWVASLWPVPLALAWMQARFGTVSPSLPFSLPLLGPEPGFVFWFVLAYIPLRLLLGRLVCPVGQDGQGAIID